MSDYGQNLPQQGDVLHVLDPGLGGDIVTRVTTPPIYLSATDPAIRGDVEVVMTTGIESMITDCLFGGNRRDDGSEATQKLQWCGNEGEKAEYVSRGRFQAIALGAPLTSASIAALEDAAVDDIMNGSPRSAVKSVTASAYIRSSRRVDMVVNVVQPNDTVYTMTVTVEQ